MVRASIPGSREREIPGSRPILAPGIIPGNDGQSRDFPVPKIFLNSVYKYYISLEKTHMAVRLSTRSNTEIMNVLQFKKYDKKFSKHAMGVVYKFMNKRKLLTLPKISMHVFFFKVSSRYLAQVRVRKIATVNRLQI